MSTVMFCNTHDVMPHNTGYGGEDGTRLVISRRAKAGLKARNRFLQTLNPRRGCTTCVCLLTMDLEMPLRVTAISIHHTIASRSVYN
jgi:hypothetical protein